MSTTTPVLGLVLYDSTTDQAVTFATFRAVWGGTPTTSNFYKIDTAVGTIQTNITALQNTRGALTVSAIYTSANYYEASASTISSYVTGMTILLNLDADSNGTVTLNINSLGTKSVMKINSSGTAVNITGGELQSGRYYLFTYDGTRWVWVNATSGDQIYINGGASGNVVTLNTDNSLLGTLTQSLLISQTINSATSKTTPVDADLFGIYDSVGTVLKSLSWANIKTTLSLIFSGSDGWTPVTETWTYASATTITVPSDATTKYQKGMKIRYKQGGGFKYAVVLSLTSTVLTIFPTTDYTLTNSTITDVSYSFSLRPLLWPDWFNYTPTLTRLSGYDTCLYRVSGLIVNWEFAASGKNVTGAGAVLISLPVAAAKDIYYPVLLGYGSTFDGAWSQTVSSSGNFNVYKNLAAGNWLGTETNVTIATEVTYRY